MMNVDNRLRLFAYPFYPFLFGVYPVLYLWSANRTQQPAYVIIPALLITLVSLLAIYLVALALTRDSHRAALISTVLSFFILTYGQFFALIQTPYPDLSQRDALLAAGLFVVAILAVVVVRRWGGPQFTRVMNMMAVVLVVLQLLQAVPYYVRVAQLHQRAGQVAGAGVLSADSLIPVTRGRELANTGPRPANLGPQRDVYYIMIDNYGRQDVLLEGSNFDNSQLVRALEQRGFIFPDCTQSNYSSTAPVIASTLNMKYLDQLGIKDIAFSERGHYDDMAPLILDSEVIRKFRGYGYHVVTFRGFMGLIDIQSSDTYINYEQDLPLTQRLETRNFARLYMETTALDAINQAYDIYPGWVVKNGPAWLAPEEKALEPEFEQVYQQNLYAFDALERVPSSIESPKFVYAHLYTAHWPFMIQPDGSLRLPFTKEQTVEGYVDALGYTNSRVLDAIDAILKNSKVKPIIILQGDHSNEWTRPVEWSGRDRLKILSAYYLPDGGDQLLYDTISPVNNFRLVFSKYFGEDLSLLEDINYYLDPRSRTIKVAPKSCMSDALKSK